jgi:hypothetical protein
MIGMEIKIQIYLYIYYQMIPLFEEKDRDTSPDPYKPRRKFVSISDCLHHLAGN